MSLNYKLNLCKNKTSLKFKNSRKESYSNNESFSNLNFVNVQKEFYLNSELYLNNVKNASYSNNRLFLNNVSYSNSGITLIALVVTIIVLIILAGVSISMISGNDGILTRSGQAKISMSVSQFEEDANLEFIKFLDKIDEINFKDIKENLVKKGYIIKEKVINESKITGISLSRTNMSLNFGESSELEVVFETDADAKEYYVEINGKNYKIDLDDNGINVEINGKNYKIDLDDNGINVEKQETEVIETNNLSVSVASSNIETKINGNKIILKDNGNENITTNVKVIYGEYEKNCNLSVVKMPEDGATETADVTFATDWGVIDIVWLDTDNNVISEPNAPILSDGTNSMLAVVYDEDEENFVRIADKSSGVWYDYNGLEDQNRWANAITANGSYFVWIPRYAYKIIYYSGYTENKDTDGNVISVTPIGNVTGFYDGYGQWKAESGEIRLELDDGIETVDVGDEKYIVHPAFMKDDDKTGLEDYARGGWSSDLAGFWCAKYEASLRDDNDNSTLQFVPNAESKRYQTIGTQYAIAINATYGYDIKNKNIDDVKSYMNSHQMKNSEWGAVAYLAHSKYGLNGKEISINNSLYYTGNSGGSATASSSDTTYEYNTKNGVKASTTQNVYGIYDLSGGVVEYVAIYDKYNSNSNINTYGWDIIGNITGIKNTVSSGETTIASTKYATKYNNQTTSGLGNNIIYTVGKVGDATKEVNTGGKYSTTDTSNTNYNWNSDYPYLLYAGGPFCLRGGHFSDGSNAGLFCSHSGSGVVNDYRSFRAVLVPIS